DRAIHGGTNRDRALHGGTVLYMGRTGSASSRMSEPILLMASNRTDVESIIRSNPIPSIEVGASAPPTIFGAMNQSNRLTSPVLTNEAWMDPPPSTRMLVIS